MKKSRPVLLCVFERKMPTVETMEISLKRVLAQENISIVFKRNVDVSNEDINTADVMILIRPHNFLSQKIAEEGKRTGVFIITFIDDDMLDLPLELPSIAWRMDSLKKVLKASELLLTSNPYLAGKYTKLIGGKRCVISDTSLSEEEIRNIPVRKEEGEIVKLVYAAGAHHTDEVRTFLFPLLNYLNENCEKKISMTFVGINPDINHKKFRFEINYKEAMTLGEYRNWMAAQKFDIGFAPLSNNSFSKYKYFNKFFEYTISGIPAIYSDRDPYKLVIRNGVNGFLAKDDINEWGRITLKLINNRGVREECVINAIDLVKDKFSDTALLSLFRTQIPELFQRCKHVTGCRRLTFYKMQYKFFLCMDTLYMIFFYFKKDGTSGVLTRTINHYKSMKVYNKG